MLNHKKSPHGFILPNLDRFDEIAKGSGVVNQMENRLIGRLHTAWQVRKEIIEVCRTHFAFATEGETNGLKTFMVLQYLEGKDHFTPMHYQFLIDTIRFLRTGYRRVHPATCLDVIEGYLEGSIKAYGRSHADLIQKEQEFRAIIETITPDEDINFIRIWLSQPTGLSDLMGSLKLLFGGNEEKIVVTAL